MTLTTFLVTLLAFAISGTVLHRRLPGTLRASERLAVTIAGVYLQFQLSLAIPGLISELKPMWIAFTSLFLTALTLLVASRYPPEPLLKLPEGEHHGETGLRYAAIAVSVLTGLWALYAILPILTQSVCYNEQVIYLSRIAQWIQDHRIAISISDDPRAIATPLPANFPALFQLLFFRSAFAIGFWNWLGWLLCGLAVYITAQRWLESRPAGIIAAGIALLAPSMLSQANGIAPTGWEIAFAVIGLHFLGHAKRRPQHGFFAHTAAAIALGCSASLQSDIPLSILLFAVLLILYRPAIRRRMVVRNIIFLLIISGWSHILIWWQFGNPCAPLLADLFGVPAGATNPMFRSMFTTNEAVVSIMRISARLSSFLLPVPLSSTDALLTIGLPALVIGLPGLLYAAFRGSKSIFSDPIFVGLFFLTLISIIVAPSLLWRETPILAPVILCGLGTGYVYKSVAQHKITSLLIATIPVIVTVILSVIFVPSLRPIDTEVDYLTKSSSYYQSFSLPDRIAVYESDWFDTWALRQPLSQSRSILTIDPRCKPDEAFWKASRNASDWLIVTDSPLHRYRILNSFLVPEGWELIYDEQHILQDSPGWIRILIFRHTERRIANNYYSVFPFPLSSSPFPDFRMLSL